MSKPETGLRQRIARALRDIGCLVLTQHGSALTGPGRSDLICCYRGRFVAIEVKMPAGKTTPAQDAFLASVKRSGGIPFVARSVKEAIMFTASLEVRMSENDFDFELSFDDDGPVPEPLEAYRPSPEAFRDLAMPQYDVPTDDAVQLPLFENLKPRTEPGTTDEKLDRLAELIEQLADSVRALVDQDAIQQVAQAAPKRRAVRAKKE